MTSPASISEPRSWAAMAFSPASVNFNEYAWPASEGWSDSRIAEALDTSIATTTILNPAPARALPASVFASVDYLTPNESELRILQNARS